MTDKAKLYAVKNDKGEWLSFDSSHESVWYTNNPTFFNDKSYAEAQAGPYGHVVELLEAPEKVVVSEDEAEILKKLDREIRTKSTGYSPWKWLSKLDDLGMAVEDAYKALAIDWVVEKPKLFLVKVPHTDDSYFYKIDDEYCNAGDSYHLEGMTDKKWFTIAEIEHYGLGECQKVVCADSARTTGEVKDNY